MERRHQSRRHERESRRKEDRKHHHHHHESHRHRKPRDGLDRGEKTIEHRSGTRERPTIDDPAAPPLSANKDYVRNWLANTNADNSVDSRQQQAIEAPKAEREFKLARQFAYLENHENPNQKRRAPPTPKKKHNTSSDSSLLEAQFFIPKEHAEESGRSKIPREQSPRPHKRRRASSTGPSPAKGSTHERYRKETFEKRARHKTREDRYEPKVQEHKAGKTVDRKRTTTTRTKKKSNRKPKKDGEELMRDFTSKSIGQDRLTIRPPYSLGLFSNGRTSNAAKDKGIPDLAFSDMDFLQKTERPRPTIEMEHLRSKSREKETRNILKGRGDIEDLSIFFNQYRKPLQEVSHNPGRDLSMERPQAPTEPPEPIRPSEPQFLYVKQIDNSPLQRPQAPSLVSAGKYTDSASRVSGKATTYLSWSETQFSPAKRRLNITDNRRQVSPIPDAIQRSIEKTGIYRDTGIEIRQYPANSPTREHATTKQRKPEKIQRSHKERQRNRHHVGHVGDVGGSRLKAAMTLTSSSQSSPPRQRISHHKNRHTRKLVNEFEAQAKAFDNRDSNTTETSGNRPTTNESRGNQVVEQFDCEVGWHKKGNPQIDHQKISESLSNSAIPETPLLDRAQLAKNAKVKRPSTTLPIVSTTATGVFSKEQNVRPATTEPTTTGITSQLPHSAQLFQQPSVHESTQQKDQSIPVQSAHNLQHNTSVPQVSAEPSAEDNVVSTQGPTCQSLAASLHQSRGSSSTIRNNQETSTLRINSPNLLGGLPLRGGLVHQFDPESRMSALPSQGPLFVRQAQHHDLILQHAIPGLGQSNIARSMNFFNPEHLGPPVVHTYRPEYTKYPNMGNLGMESQDAAVYPEDEAYGGIYYDAGDGQMIDEKHSGYDQGTLMNEEQYTDDPPQEMDYPDNRMTTDWYEGEQYQQQDDGHSYYDGRLLVGETFSEHLYQEENRQENFVSGEGLIQRTDFQNGDADYPENLWRHQQLY